MIKLERIPFDIPSLIKNKLTLEQYFILYCIVYKDKQCLEDYVKSVGKFNESNLNMLLEKNLLFSIGYSDIPTFDELIPTESAYELLGLAKSDSWFEEIWSLYPRHTPNGRVLKQISKDKAKKKYLKHASTESQHRDIVTLLRKELRHRTLSNGMNYLQNMETWLNNESWKAFIDDKLDKPNTLSPGQSEVE